MNFDVLTRYFLRSREDGTSGAKTQSRPTSIKNYRDDLEIIFSYFEKAKSKHDWDELNKLDFLDFYEACKGKVMREEWSDATRQKVYRTLRTLMNYIEKDEDMRDEGVKSWRKTLPAIGQTPMKIFIPTQEELKRFTNQLKATTKSGYRDYVAWRLMLDTGMRSGELRHLKLSHLKFDDNMILVPEEGKTGHRLVPLRLDTIKMLKAWLRFREKFAKCEYVMVTQSGTQLTKFTLIQSFKQATEDAGTPGITPHTARHVFCTYYLKAGGDIAKLKLITGHSSYDILNRYLHLAQVGRKEMQAELERVSPLRQLEKVG